MFSFVLLSGSLAVEGLSDEEKAKIEEAITQATSDATADVKAAREKLLAEFDKAVQKLKDDDPRVATLEGQRSLFVEEKELPQHPLMAKASKAYSKAMQAAQKARDKKLDKVLRGSRSGTSSFGEEHARESSS